MITLRPEKFGGIIFNSRNGIQISTDQELFLAFYELALSGANQAKDPKLKDLLDELQLEGREEYRMLERMPGERGQGYEFEVLSGPVLADLQITDKCYLECPHCYAGSTRTGRHASWQDLIRALDNFKDAGVFEVALGGGEPLLYPRLIQLLSEIRKRGMVPNLATSGAELNAIQIPFLKKYLGAIALSIEHIGDKFKKRRHFDFIKFEQAAQRIKKAGIKLVFQVTVSPKNIDELETTVGYLKSHEPYGIIFLTYKPVGRGKVYDSLLETLDQKELARQLKNIAAGSDVKFGYDCCLAPLLFDENSPDFYGCSAVRSSIAVDLDLNAVPCSFSSSVLGNLRDSSLPDIWNSESAKSFRSAMAANINNGACANCKHRLNCAGGCPEFPLVGCQVREAASRQ